jgi:hypothetical protein
LGAQYRVRSRRKIEQRYALFFRLAQVPVEKREGLIDRTLQLWEESLEVTPTSILAKVDTLPEADVRAVLGEEGYAQWSDLVLRADVARTWSLEIATAASASAEPMSLDQIARLHQIVREHSREYQSGAKINERTVDWETVEQKARAVLTDGQWEHAQSYLLMRKATHVLEKLAATSGTPATNSP